MSRRLILFDIDGTLIAPGPIPRALFGQALSQVLGREISLSFNDVAGATDPTIAAAVLRREGMADGQLARGVQQVLDWYAPRVAEQLPGSGTVTVHGGAEALVHGCLARGWDVALLTGNLPGGAKAKLADTGLWDLFSFGIFGDEGNSRVDLPPLAREKAWDRLGKVYHAHETILVGDTPADAQVARLAGMRSLVVCRRDEPQWREAILAEEPTWLVDNFEDTEQLLNTLEEENT